MADVGTGNTFVSFELIETWKENNVCFYCGKTIHQDKLKCEKCLEFEYCSIQCLENDRDTHEIQCTFISMRKDLRHLVSIQVFDLIASNAKLLDAEGDLKDKIEISKELEAIKRPKRTEENNRSHPVKNGKVVSGKFGRPVTCSRQDLSGQKFGQDWLKTERNKESLLMKSVPSFQVVLDTIKVTEKDYTRMTSADFYPDSDEETLVEKNGTQQIISNNIKSNPTKAKDKSPRKNAKSTAKDRVEDAKVVNTKNEKVDEECRNKTDGGPGAPICSFCGKMGNDLKSCMGCKKRKYCDTNCLSNDLKIHNIQCKRDQRFQAAVRNIPTTLLAAMWTGVSLSPLTLTFEKKEAGRARQSILLEIVNSSMIFFGFGITTKDSTGRHIFIGIHLPHDSLFDKVNNQTGEVTTVKLHTCLRPRNFILVFDPNCVSFIDGTPAFTITKLERFCVVLTDCRSTS